MEQDYPIGDPSSRTPFPPPPPPRNPWILVGIVVALFAGAAAIWLYWRSPAQQAPDAAPTAAAPAAETPAAGGPLGAEAEPRELPPLDLTDPVVRELAAGLSSRPELAAWLASNQLIRNFVVIVDNVALGRTPTAQLRRVAPRGEFAVQERGDVVVVDARSYARYDGIAEAVDSLDAQGLAKAYAILRPRLQEAYRELGYPDGNFDTAMERAIVRLLRVPAIQPEVQLTQAPVLYKYVDERLESLAPVEKQLLRMGPRNVRVVQAKLREIAEALNIPRERLP